MPAPPEHAVGQTAGLPSARDVNELGGSSACACPLCGARETWDLVRWAKVPVHQNLLYPTAEAARGARRGTLALRGCSRCQFVFNADFDLGLLEYGSDYDNRQTFSPMFTRYVEGLIEGVVGRARGGRIIEVGCGKGVFLRELVRRAGGSASGIGFDPTYVGPEDDGPVRFRKSFFEPGMTEPADVVICRHVIEHVPQPARLLSSLRAAVKETGRVYVETPCVAWILEHGVTWDLFYEHCSLFTQHALNVGFGQAGLAVQSSHHVFEGQYLWVEGAPAGDPQAARVDTHLRRLADSFIQHSQSALGGWNALLMRLRRTGPVIVWGAGAKGVTFCNLTDADGSRIDALVDVNPAKQGKYLAGTGHPIRAPHEIATSGGTILVLNPNYRAEIVEHLRRLRFEGNVLDLMNEGSLAA